MSCVVGTYESDVAFGISTHEERSPVGLHLRHEYVKVIGSVPVQTPGPSVSVSSTMFWPRIGGVAVFFAGRETTGSVASEFCVAVPCAFVAVTARRSRLPKSSVDGAYDAKVAP